jgi:uncharacterized membrane protein YkoI
MKQPHGAVIEKEIDIMKNSKLNVIAAVTVVALTIVSIAVVFIGVGTGFAQAAAQVSQKSDKAVTQPYTSLAQAVRSAEQRTNGRAAKVELERDDGVYIYEVKTVSADGPAEVSVDFATGKIENVEGRGFFAKIGDVFDRDDKQEDAALQKALEASSVTLSRAIDAAETTIGGRAIKAKMKDQYGSMYYEVALIVDGSIKRVQVDTTTAKVVAVKARKDRDDDDDDDDDD